MARRTLAQLVRHQFQTRFWGLDIHPSARIATDAYIDRTNPRGVHIARNCVIDSHAAILTHDMTRGIRPHTFVGEGAHIGVRAIVMPGITIGKNARIAPGAVVTRDVEDGALVAGNPAKPVSVDV